MAPLRTTNRLARIGAVTAGLGATGAVVGACCAAIAVTMISIVETKSAFIFSFEFFRLLGIVALAGAATGIVGAPALAWGLLRRVPLGRAIVVTAIATIAGAILGEMLFPFNPYRNVIPGVIVCGWLGFLLAGLALRLLSRHA
jgi:hypothetical protein